MTNEYLHPWLITLHPPLQCQEQYFQGHWYPPIYYSHHLSIYYHSDTMNSWDIREAWSWYEGLNSISFTFKVSYGTQDKSNV